MSKCHRCWESCRWQAAELVSIQMSALIGVLNLFRHCQQVCCLCAPLSHCQQVHHSCALKALQGALADPSTDPEALCD